MHLTFCALETIKVYNNLKIFAICKFFIIGLRVEIALGILRGEIKITPTQHHGYTNALEPGALPYAPSISYGFGLDTRVAGLSPPTTPKATSGAAPFLRKIYKNY